MSDYKVNFKDMKSRVGVDDIAYALGYRLDRKAGVGRYIELVLGEGNYRRGIIIVSHPHNKAAQTFFRRDGSKGDVVTLIRENLNSFPVFGFRHIGEACHHLGNLLPIVLARYQE